MPTEQKVTRKLRAILSADVKGYSILMVDDEVATIQTLKDYRNIMSAYIEDHGGRVVDAIGDNLLAEFGSAVDAVQCAVEVQKKLKEKNQKLPEGKRLQFRIGINIGDVIQDGDRIFGDGVNIAARIEGLADAGGICISRNAYDHIKKKLKLGYEYLGDHEVKNIKDPVRVYKVLMDPEDAGKLIGEKAKHAKKKWIWPVVLVAAIIVTSIIWYFLQNLIEPDIEPVSVETITLQLPDKPSIAVLPFENMSGDPKQEYLSDGMTDELIGNLAKINDIFVISRNSSFTYKGKSVKVQKIAKDLNVRYILEGSLQKSGNKIRIRAQLIDGKTDHHLWTEKYDGEMDDIFKLQDRITGKIVAALAVQLSDDEKKRVTERGTDKIDAYDEFLKGMEKYLTLTPKGVSKAIDHYKNAIIIDPNYYRAFGALANAYSVIAWEGFSEKLGMDFSTTAVISSHYLKLAMQKPTYEAYRASAYLSLKLKRHEEAISYAIKSLELAPNESLANFALGTIYIFSGKLDEGVKYCKKAALLDKQSTGLALSSIGLAYFIKGNYEKAISYIQSGMELNSNLNRYSLLASCLGHLGRKKDAKKALNTYLIPFDGKFPGFQVAFNGYHFKDSELFDRLAFGLVKAGVKDNPSDYCKVQKENRLSGVEIDKLTIGKTFRGVVYNQRVKWSFSRDENGNINYKIRVMGNEEFDSGITKIEEDMLCFKLKESFGGYEWCVDIYKNPEGAAKKKTEYIIVSDHGTYPFSVEK